MSFSPQTTARILVNPVHADDELACAATLRQIARTVDRPAIHVALLAHDANSVRAAESVAAFHELLAGTGTELSFAFGAFGDQKLFEQQFAVIQFLENEIQAFKPSLIFGHDSTAERHPDHVVASECLLTATRGFHGSVLSFCSPSNVASRWAPNVYNEISREDLSQKIRSLRSYASQAGKIYLSKDYHWTRARFFGIEVGIFLVEPFRLVRSVSTLRALPMIDLGQSCSAFHASSDSATLHTITSSLSRTDFPRPNGEGSRS